MGYPQGKKRSPAVINASMRNATRSLPWSQALAPSKSVFLKCPNAMMDFKRLKTSSICHRPRYISNTVAGAKLRSNVVKTKVYAAASMVSALTLAPFLPFSCKTLSWAFSAASLLFFRAQSLPGIWAFSYGTQTSQSPSRVLVSVLNRFNKANRFPCHPHG